MIHLMIGFLLFCACVAVAIRMWRPLLIIAAGIAAIGAAAVLWTAFRELAPGEALSLLVLVALLGAGVYDFITERLWRKPHPVDILGRGEKPVAPRHLIALPLHGKDRL